MIKPVASASFVSSGREASFQIADSECYLEEITHATHLVRKSLETLNSEFVKAVRDVKAFRVSWPRRQNRYHFILLRVFLKSETKIIDYDSTSKLGYQSRLIETATKLHDSFDAFEARYAHSEESLVPLSAIDEYMTRKGLQVEKASEYAVNRVIFQDLGKMDYSTNFSSITGSSEQVIEKLEGQLRDVVTYLLHHKISSLLIVVRYESDRGSGTDGFSIIGEPHRCSINQFGWSSIQVRAASRLDDDFWRYALLLAVLDTLRIELLFVRETAFATQGWTKKTATLFDFQARERGFIYVDVTHEILAQLKAWSPNLTRWLSFLRNDIRYLSSDRLAALPEVRREIDNAIRMLADVETIETDLGKTMPALLDRVNNRWDEMKTRIVIQQTQGNILSDIRLLSKQLEASSELALQFVNQHQEQLVQLLTQIEERLQTSHPDQCRIAESWKDKVRTGIGLFADAVAIFSFFTGVISIPAVAPLLYPYWELLFTSCPRDILRRSGTVR